MSTPRSRPNAIHHRISVLESKTYITLKPITTLSIESVSNSNPVPSTTLHESHDEVIMIHRNTGSISRGTSKDVPAGSAVSPSFKHPVYGLVGIIHLISGPFLIFITDAVSTFNTEAIKTNKSKNDKKTGEGRRQKVISKVGRYKDVLRIKKVKFLSFAIDRQYLSAEQKAIENEYIDVISKLLARNGFYFSYSIDITNSAQRSDLAAIKSHTADSSTQSSMSNLLTRLSSSFRNFVDATSSPTSPTNGSNPSSPNSTPRKKQSKDISTASSSRSHNSTGSSSNNSSNKNDSKSGGGSGGGSSRRGSKRLSHRSSLASISSNASTREQLSTAFSSYYRQPLHKRVDDRFFWNSFLLSSFIERDYSEWILPIMCGYIATELASFGSSNDTAAFTLISRRSIHYAGCRYKKRGIDEHGHVANFVESEQILVPPDGSLMSYQITRGSVPVFWTQKGYKYRPKPKLTKASKHSRAAMKKHFTSQISHYGAQISINLLNQHGVETRLTKAYEDGLNKLNNPKISYVPFDFHEVCKGMNYDNVSILVEQIRPLLMEHSYYTLPPSSSTIGAEIGGNRLDSAGSSSEATSPTSSGFSPLPTHQTAVFRVNCLDCLDRTNLVQSYICIEVINSQLRASGLIASNETIESTPAFRERFKHIWFENGNAMSLQYAGTPALKGDFTKTGKRNLKGMTNDAINSLTRYYKNTFRDGMRQAGYDLVLGNQVIQTPTDGEDLKDIVEEEENQFLNWDEEQDEAILYCRSRILSGKKEKYLGGWVVVSINKWDAEQERILFVTDRAIYRAKYDFLNSSILHYVRVPLTEIKTIRKGQFKLATLLTSSDSGMYGFRIYTFKPEKEYGTASTVPDPNPGLVPSLPADSDVDYTSKNSKKLGVNIVGSAKKVLKPPTNYRTYMSIYAYGKIGRDITAEIVETITAAAGVAVHVTEGEIDRNTGVISNTFNKLKLGMFSTRKKNKHTAKSPRHLRSKSKDKRSGAFPMRSPRGSATSSPTSLSPTSIPTPRTPDSPISPPMSPPSIKSISSGSGSKRKAAAAGSKSGSSGSRGSRGSSRGSSRGGSGRKGKRKGKEGEEKDEERKVEQQKQKEEREDDEDNDDNDESNDEVVQQIVHSNPTLLPPASDLIASYTSESAFIEEELNYENVPTAGVDI